MLDQNEGAGTAPAAGSPAADEIAGRRDVRPTADPAHEETEPPAASLFKSSETDQRNGHLYIDTAPLLLTFRDREDEPTGRPHRRGGRHRRSDSDAAG
jgi:hypothetical protein